MTTTRRNLEWFLARPWETLREAKDRATAARIVQQGADAAFELADALREHARAMGAIPSEADRAEDLATAVRLRKLLDHARPKRPRRAR